MRGHILQKRRRFRGRAQSERLGRWLAGLLDVPRRPRVGPGRRHRGGRVPGLPDQQQRLPELLRRRRPPSLQQLPGQRCLRVRAKPAHQWARFAALLDVPRWQWERPGQRHRGGRQRQCLRHRRHPVHGLPDPRRNPELLRGLKWVRRRRRLRRRALPARGRDGVAALLDVPRRLGGGPGQRHRGGPQSQRRHRRRHQFEQFSRHEWQRLRWGPAGLREPDRAAAPDDLGHLAVRRRHRRGDDGHDLRAELPVRRLVGHLRRRLGVVHGQPGRQLADGDDPYARHRGGRLLVRPPSW